MIALTTYPGSSIAVAIKRDGVPLPIVMYTFPRLSVFGERSFSDSINTLESRSSWPVTAATSSILAISIFDCAVVTTARINTLLNATMIRRRFILAPIFFRLLRVFLSDSGVKCYAIWPRSAHPIRALSMSCAYFLYIMTDESRGLTSRSAIPSFVLPGHSSHSGTLNIHPAQRPIMPQT